MQGEYQAILTAPFGKLGIRMCDGELEAIDFLSGDAPALAPRDTATNRICDRLSRYLRQPDTLSGISPSPQGTPFQQRVWRAICAVPCGHTITYGELAARVDSGPRAVANACGANPIPILVPCHRIVARNGLGGFMGGRSAASLAIKQWLLLHERSRPATA